MKRLLIVADHVLVVDAIRLALRQTAGFEVVGFIDGRHDVTAQIARLCPDVVVVDDMRDAGHALARLREITEAAPDVKVVLLSDDMGEERLEHAFDAGAGAVVSKGVHPVALGTLLREIVQGNVVHPRRVAAPVPEECPLTAREVEILGFAAQGYTNGRIARELWVTEQTVKFHLSNTYRKLGVANRTEATRYAFLNDLVAPHEQLAS